jgi:hypothetical protein
MKTAELFCGTKSFSKVMEKHGHSTWTVDSESVFDADWIGDIREINKFPHKIDILCASPPFTAFSVARIGTHWGGGKNGYIPKTDAARLGMELVQHTLKLIESQQPTWWFIENPRGVLRKMPFMDGMFRHTISYCQYGDKRMKPTDIWTNAWWWHPRRICRNGDSCHEAAPRGAKTGTQGLEGAKDRGRIPPALFEEILKNVPTA